MLGIVLSDIQKELIMVRIEPSAPSSACLTGDVVPRPRGGCFLMDIKIWR
jgi:hypothetical protein